LTSVAVSHDIAGHLCSDNCSFSAEGFVTAYPLGYFGHAASRTPYLAFVDDRDVGARSHGDLSPASNCNVGAFAGCRLNIKLVDKAFSTSKTKAHSTALREPVA
jgi:hypothetical protein